MTSQIHSGPEPVTFRVTVQDVLRLALPQGSSLLAGAAGLDRAVQWAGVLHSPSSLADNVEEGELILLGSGHGESQTAVADTSLANLIRELAAVGAAAVALVGDPGSDAIAVAGSLHFPLVRLPDGTRPHEAERAIIGLIVNRRAELEERGVQIYRRLALLVAANKGVGAIIMDLQEITGKVALLQDEAGVPRFHAGGLSREDIEQATEGTLTGVESWLRTATLVSTAPPLARFPLARPGLARFVAPIVVDQRVVGIVSVMGVEGELTELDRVATGRAAAVCALEMAKQQAVAAAENRIRGDFLADLLEGGFATEEAATRRAEILGYRLVLPCAVVAYMADRIERPADPALAKAEVSLAFSMAEEVGRWEPRALHYGTENQLTVLYPADGSRGLEAVKARVEAVRAAMAIRLPQVRVAAGIGRVCSRLRDLQESYQEAQQALSMAANLFGGDRTAAFGDLGVYRLLFPLQGTRELAAFHEETLGPLLAHDRSRHGELLETLRAFLTYHGNLSQTAKALYLHRNTLTYRIRRIQEVTGLDLDDAESRLRLQLALKIHEIGSPRP